ncbi:hypothetical protein G7020_20055 [Pseudomonas stutzeri]|nr:hypothetical protein [Stutzerimonas stutzeri]
MGGRISVESVVRCSWNGWPDDRGIRSLTYNIQTDEIRWEHFKMLLHSQAGRGKRGRKSKLQLH